MPGYPPTEVWEPRTSSPLTPPFCFAPHSLRSGPAGHPTPIPPFCFAPPQDWARRAFSPRTSARRPSPPSAPTRCSATRLWKPQQPPMTKPPSTTMGRISAEGAGQRRVQCGITARSTVRMRTCRCRPGGRRRWRGAAAAARQNRRQMTRRGSATVARQNRRCMTRQGTRLTGELITRLTGERNLRLMGGRSMWCWTWRLKRPGGALAVRGIPPQRSATTSGVPLGSIRCVRVLDLTA